MLACLLGPSCAREPQPPSLVLLVSLDTLRADRLECYGYGRATAPNLAALAEESLLFTTVGAQAAQTLVSNKSMFTARYPLDLLAERTGGGLADMARAARPERLVVEAMRAVDATLVEQLRRHGYRTAAFTDGLWMTREMGFEHGFEHFDDGGGHLARIVPRVAAWLARERGLRTFLFVQAYDVHCPYVSREPYDSRFCEHHGEHLPLDGRCPKGDLEDEQLTALDRAAIGDHYDGGIASADAYVGELFAELRRLDLWDDALVVVTSDHGESLGEHGRLGHGELFVEELMVPLLVKPPRSWGLAPRRVEAPAELVDLMPTLLDACGVPLPAGVAGRSLLPLARGEAGGRAYLVAQTAFRDAETRLPNPLERAIVAPGAWALVDEAGHERPALFDLRSGVPGGRPWGEAPPPEAAALLEALRAHDPPSPGPGDAARGEGAARPPITDEQARDLHALGYGED